MTRLADHWAHLFAGLAGELELAVTDSSDAFVRNMVVVRAVVRCRHQPGLDWGAYQVVPRQLLAEGEPGMAVVLGALARQLQPWLEPDRNPMPRLVWWPRLDRAERAMRRRLATYQVRRRLRRALR